MDASRIPTFHEVNAGNSWAFTLWKVGIRLASISIFFPICLLSSTASYQCCLSGRESIVKEMTISKITNQLVARLEDPTKEIEDELVHPENLKMFNHDEVKSKISAAEIRATDLGKLIVLKIHDHTTQDPEHPEKLLSYDFKVEFQDKLTAWLPWKEVASLAIYRLKHFG